MNAIRRALVASASLVAVVGAAAADLVLRGSGRPGVERRNIGTFDRLAVAGAFEIELRQGDGEGVELSGDENLLAAIVTRVEARDGGAVLRIEPKRGVVIQAATPIRVRVDHKTLAALDLAGASHVVARSLSAPTFALVVGGAGRVELASLQSDRLSVDIGGSGSVVLAGRAGGLKLSIAGSGQCSAGGLEADGVAIDIAGSGEASVQAKRQLAVAIAGSGRVVHSGPATPSVSIAGSGTVTRG